jgi:uncharacterized protein (UPF0332 family)
VIHKARENAETANVLVAWRYFDAAANRLYYALYHCGWAFMVKRGRDVPQRSTAMYFPHHDFHRHLDEEGLGGCLGLPQDWPEQWDEVQNLRIKADYRRDSVRGEELDDVLIGFVQGVVSKARAFVASRT